MARRRYISTKISHDANVNQLACDAGDFAALLYTWLIPHAEDDGTVKGSATEILYMVCPGRRDKTSADVDKALKAMQKLGLAVWDGECVFFPPEAFYRFQTYIKDERRRSDQPERTGPPKKRAKRRKTAQRAENAASVSVSASVSSSVTTPQSPTGSTPPSPERVVEIWNEERGPVLPEATSLNDERRRKIKARTKPERDEDWWRAYVRRIAASDFCTGAGPRSWVAGLDWAINSESNITKVTEGTYDNRGSPPGSGLSKAQRNVVNVLDRMRGGNDDTRRGSDGDGHGERLLPAGGTA